MKKLAKDLQTGDRIDLEGCTYLDSDDGIQYWAECELGEVDSVWGGWADGSVPGNGVPVYIANAPFSAIVVPEDYEFEVVV